MQLKLAQPGNRKINNTLNIKNNLSSFLKQEEIRVHLTVTCGIIIENNLAFPFSQEHKT